MESDILRKFKELKNVKTVRMLDDIFNFKMFNDPHNIDYNTSLFNFGPNTLVLFDCEDYNSAFVHEWYYNAFLNDEIKSEFDVIYIESNSNIRKFIKRWHKEVNNIPVEDYPQKKFEIFILAVVNGEILTKSDDFDVVNETAILSIIEIFNNSQN